MTLNAETAYLFRHAAIREAATSLLSADAKAELHGMALELLESLHNGALPEAWTAELADHALQAQQAPGADIPALQARELDYLQRAATHAARQWDNSTSLETRQRIADHPLSAPGTRLRALLDCVETLMRTGGLRRAPSLVERALQVAREIGDPTAIGDAIVCKAQVAGVLGRHDESVARAHEALACGREAQNVALQAKALICLASAAQATGDWAVSEQHALEAWELLKDGGQPVSRGRSLLYVGNSRWQRGRLTDAVASFEDARQIFKAAGNPGGEATALDHLGSVLLELGRLDEGKKHLTLAARAYETIGDSVGYGSAISNLAGVLEAAGDLEQARSLRVQALKNFKAAGAASLEGIGHGNLAAVQKKLGRLEAASFNYQRAADVLRRCGRAVEQAVFDAMFGQLLLVLGFVDAAATNARQAGDALDKLGTVNWRAQYVTPLEVRIDIQRGNLRAAHDRLVALRRIADGGPEAAGVAAALKLSESLFNEAEKPQALLFRGHQVDELAPTLKLALLDRMEQVEPDDLAQLRRKPWLLEAMRAGTDGLTVPKWETPED